MKFYEVSGEGTVKPIEIEIPSTVVPQASGDYVVEEIQRQYAGLVVPTSTATTIAFAAKEAEKDGLKLKSVQVGFNIVFFSLNLEWEKQSPQK